MTDALKTVVVDRPANSAKQVAHTELIALSPVRIVLTRAARVYCQTLSGLLVAAGLGVPAALGANLAAAITMLQAFGVCMILALFPAMANAIWNTGELLAKLDETSPQFRA